MNNILNMKSCEYLRRRTSDFPFRTGLSPHARNRRSLAAHAKKKKQKEYGSGREQFGLPPLENSGEEVVVPKLADYIEFGKLMGEKPTDVTRQLQLNNTAVELDEGSMEMLSDWESEEMRAYAVFEALMDNELGGSESAASATLARNKNRLALSDLIASPKRSAPAQLSAAQRKLAKNKGRSTAPLAAQGLKGLGGLASLVAPSRGGAAAFERLAAKPMRPGAPTPAARPKAPTPSLRGRPQLPGMQVQGVLDDEDASFLDDDDLWTQVSGAAPTYEEFNRALGGGQAVGSAGHRSATAPKRPTGAAPTRVVNKLIPPAPLLPKPSMAGPGAPDGPKARAKPATLAAPPQRPGPPAKPALPAPKAVPALSSRPSLPPQPKSPPPSQPQPALPPTATPPQAAAKPVPQKAPARPSPVAAAPQALQPQPPRARAPAPQQLPAAAATGAEEQTGLEASEAAVVPDAAARRTAAREAPTEDAGSTPAEVEAAHEAPQQPAQQEQAAAGPPSPQRPSLRSLTGAAVAATAVAALVGKPAAPRVPQQPAAAAAAAQPLSASQTPPAEGPPAGGSAGQAGAEQEGRQLARPQLRAGGRGDGECDRPARQGRPRRGAEQEQAMRFAKACMESGQPVQVKVWQVNAAGVLVQAGPLSGFIPMTQLTTRRGMRVLEEEERLVAQQALQTPAPALGTDAAEPRASAAPAGAAEDGQRDGGEAQRTALRRQAMGVLLGDTLSACVIVVKEEAGQVVLSERAAAASRFQEGKTAAPDLQSAEVAAAAYPLVGRVLPVTIRSVKPFGCFVEFELPPAAVAAPAASTPTTEGAPEGEGAEGQSGGLKGVGLVHASQLSWDVVQDPSEVVEVGQVLPAVISHVDLEKGRVFLSIRHATIHPLQETLETLLQLSSPLSGALPGRAADGGAPGTWAETLPDLRPALGNMADAVRLCEALLSAPGVAAAQPGVRLQSRASAQALEVYLSKETDPEGEAGGEAAAPEGTTAYRLILRKGLSVQEIAVIASLTRDEVRQLALDTVAEMVDSGE